MRRMQRGVGGFLGSGWSLQRLVEFQPFHLSAYGCGFCAPKLKMISVFLPNVTALPLRIAGWIPIFQSWRSPPAIGVSMKSCSSRVSSVARNVLLHDALERTLRLQDELDGVACCAFAAAMLGDEMRVALHLRARIRNRN